MIGLIIQWIVACGVVFGGLAVAWRATQRRGMWGGTSPHLRQLAALSLGPRRGLIVVKVGGSTLLLAFHEHGMSALGPVADWPVETDVSNFQSPAVRDFAPRFSRGSDWAQRMVERWATGALLDRRRHHKASHEAR